jgi:hypothetical protein
MKTMSRESMDQLVNDHFKYEATDDIEGVLRTLTDDAKHEIVGGPDGPLRGQPAIRRFYERLFADLKGNRVEPVMRLYGDDFLVDETIWIGHVVDGRPFNSTAGLARYASGFCTSSSCGMGSSRRRTSGSTSTTERQLA